MHRSVDEHRLPRFASGHDDVSVLRNKTDAFGHGLKQSTVNLKFFFVPLLTFAFVSGIILSTGLIEPVLFYRIKSTD